MRTVRLGLLASLANYTYSAGMKERCRDGCRTSLLIAGVVLVSAIFHTLLPPCHPYITSHFMEMIFSTCIYIYHGRCHTANRLRVSKLTQLTIFHTSSPRVYRHGDSSRRCTVATVQDEANPSSSQPAASCCVASESTEAHTDGWPEYVLTEESVLPRKQPKRKRGV